MTSAMYITAAAGQPRQPVNPVACPAFATFSGPNAHNPPQLPKGSGKTNHEILIGKTPRPMFQYSGLG